MRRTLFACATTAILTTFIVGGVAWALQSPIDGNGVIHACYNPTTGAMSLDTKGACPARGKTTPITWNAQGPQGPPGPPGDPGTGAIASYKRIETVDSIPAGQQKRVEANCPAGFGPVGGGYVVTNATNIPPGPPPPVTIYSSGSWGYHMSNQILMGWEVDFYNADTVDQPVKVSAVCVPVPSYYNES
jgi:hypothetical protein